MKKLISITLALAMILSFMCIPAIGAEVETSTTDALKAASINGSDHNQAKVGGSRLLIGGSSAWGYGRKTLVTYDLSAYDAENLPDRFYLQMGSDLADTIAILKDGEFVIEVFETTDNSSYDFATATYANTFDNGSIVKGDVIAELTPANGIALTASNTNYYGLRADISKSVKEHILKGDSTVTYLLAVDPARGMKKADGTVVTYLGMYFATADYGSWPGTQQLRPKLITADIPEEDINTVKSVKVTNGLLTEEFDPEALDDKENLVKTYEIAVINESADVSISYELTTPRSYVEGEVITGNLEFGPTDLSIPVYSENGELRTYNFKLVKMDEETKASFADYDLADAMIIAAPQGSPAVEYKTGTNDYQRIYDRKKPDGTMDLYGRHAVIRYDISEIPETAQNIKASVGMTVSDNADYANDWLNNEYTIGVYAIPETDMKWEWTVDESGKRSITRESLYKTAPATSVALREMGDRIGEIVGTKNGSDDVETVKTTQTSIMATGVRASVDVTGYVNSVKAANPEAEFITLVYSIEDFSIDNPDASTDANGNTTFGLYIRNDSYNYNVNYQCENFRPRLDWYDFGLDSENGIENVEVKNGILVDEFEPYAVDDYETLTKTYKIAVLDEASNVSVSYNLISEKSTDEGAVTSGNLEFGPEIITVPVTSESGVTRTYKFELVSFADAGLQVAYPSVGYAYRTSNPFVAKDTDMLYLYGNTNITDGSKFDGGAIKLYSPNFAEKKVALDDKTLAYADANGKFGLQLKANVKSIGNTLMVVPSYKYLGKELDGEEYIIKADGIGAAATIGKVGDVVGDNGRIINSEKISYSLKATNYRNDLGSVDMLSDGYPGAMRISGWASNAPNYNARRIAVLQFALSDDMLDAENIEFSFGANSVAQTNNNADSENLVKALRDKGIVITVSEATNLNNEWKYKTDRAGILAEGETSVSKSRIFDIEVNENTLELVNYTYNSSGALSSHHSAGYRIHGGGEAFTNFIKNKIKAGEKLVNLTVEISELQSFYDAMDSNVQGLYIWGASEYSVGGSYNNGRNYMHPFLASLRW